MLDFRRECRSGPPLTKALWYSNSMRIITFFILLISFNAHALMTEFSYQYSYNKRTYSATNSLESQSNTVSVSFYLWEFLALETSYTNGLSYQVEGYSTGSTNYNLKVTSNFDVYGLDLILSMGGRRSAIQPYIKGGSSYTKKTSTINDGFQVYSISPSTGWGPDYGAGLKIILTETLSLRVSYDAWQTPLDDGTTSTDAAARAGFSWLL